MKVEEKKSKSFNSNKPTYKKCPHGKQKIFCRDCGGLGFCIHNKRKSRCFDCGGSEFCIHNKFKVGCKECSPNSFCIHGKEKSRCFICKGSGVCEHNNRKSRCIDCGGSQICKHSKRKDNCKECFGSQTCMHNKFKVYCKPCGGNRLCKSSWCETIGNKKYEGFCLNCFIHLFPDKPNTRNYKTKEKNVADYILTNFPNFTWATDKKVENGCSLRRPDLLLDLGSHIIIIEVDENKHSDYDCSCENKRLMELSQDLYHRPIVFIRFNPDSYTDVNGKVVKSCWSLNKLGIQKISCKKLREWEERLNVLREQVQYWIDNQSEKTIEIIQLFY